MNTIEKLSAPRDLTAAGPMAARAMALCEGCPMAKFCVVKDVAPCETPVVKNLHIEAGGGYDGSTLDKPIRTSYRADLFDDSKLTIMADLQKQKEKQKIQTKPVERSSTHISQLSNKVQQPDQPRAATKPITKKPTAERVGERAPDLIARIFMSMIGVNGLATVKAKKSV